MSNYEDTINFVVNNKTINIPVSITDIVVQGDTNSRIITFELNRYFDGVDLSSTTIKINYENSDNLTGSDDVSNIILTEDKIYFDWAIKSELTINSGEVLIAIDCYNTDTDNNVIYRWQTVPLSFNVLENIKVKNDAIALTYENEKIFVNSYDNSIVLNDIHDTNEPFTITNRTIDMPIYKNVVVSKDNNSQIISFTIDRYFDNVDLSNKTIAIKFENALGESDRAFAVNISCTENKITFGWLIDSKVTKSSGYVLFAIEFLGYLDNGEFYCWQTKPSKLEVSEGLYVDGSIEEPTPSWIQSWQIQAGNIMQKATNAEKIAIELQEEIKNINSGGTVDQIYNSESENAQSGKAINGALSKYCKILEAQGYILINRLFDETAMWNQSSDYRNIIKFSGVIGDNESNILLPNGNYLCFGAISDYSIACWACGENVLYTIKRTYENDGSYTYKVTSSKDISDINNYYTNKTVDGAFAEIGEHLQNINSDAYKQEIAEIIKNEYEAELLAILGGDESVTE
jgi:hypothetical protein